jgi:hypothetical protein
VSDLKPAWLNPASRAGVGDDVSLSRPFQAHLSKRERPPRVSHPSVPSVPASTAPRASATPTHKKPSPHAPLLKCRSLPACHATPTHNKTTLCERGFLSVGVSSGQTNSHHHPSDLYAYEYQLGMCSRFSGSSVGSFELGTTHLSSTSTCPDAINCRALCGANLVTELGKMSPFRAPLRPTCRKERDRYLYECQLGIPFYCKPAPHLILSVRLKGLQFPWNPT